MVARLVVDALWRHRWGYLVLSGILLVCWLMYVTGGDNVLELSITTLSLIFAAVFGPMFAIAALGVRELRHLPVTQRDLWRATWVVATVVSTALLLLTKLISALLVAANGGTSKISTEAMLLSAVYDFTWAGALLLLLPLLGYGGHAVARSGAVAASLPAAVSIVAALACFALPILVSDALPTRVGEFTSATTAVLIAGLAIAVGAVAWTPQRGVMAAERAQAQRAVILAGTATRRRLVDRLTGMSRVVVPHLLATVALPVGAGLALAAYGVISGSGPWWFVPRAPTVFDPMDTGEYGLTLFVLVPCGVVTMLSLWAPWARLLKVLPLSAGQINALLLLTPFATWTILWLLGWSAYVFAYGTPHTLRVEFVFGIAAIGALAHAFLLRFQGSPATVWIIALSGGLMPQLVKVALRDGAVPQIVFAVIGAVALCTAAFVNHRTLTRSTSSSLAYRRLQQPFGISAKLMR